MAAVKSLIIGSRRVGDGEPCYILAEAGVNHNGRVDLATQLIEVAAQAKADAVKFQKRTVRDILIAEALKAPYVKPGSLGATYGEHREALELTQAAYQELAATARAQGITFMASAWDPKSADLLESLGMPAYKIASADVTNLPLIAHIARKRKPVILSTGMSSMEEIGEALDTVRRVHDDVILLQCTSVYPCDNRHIHLRVMETYRKTFDALVGYSGHERGLAVTEAAVAMGAVLIERHFTLDRTLPGPDHAASLEPRGLELLVRNIRNIEEALGTPEKRVLPEERQVRDRLAKSVAAACAIPAGTVITERHLTVKGPGTGLAPRHLPQLVGVKAARDIAEDTLIPKEALEWGLSR